MECTENTSNLLYYKPFINRQWLYVYYELYIIYTITNTINTTKATPTTVNRHSYVSHNTPVSTPCESSLPICHLSILILSRFVYLPTFFLIITVTLFQNVFTYLSTLLEWKGRECYSMRCTRTRFKTSLTSTVIL